MIFCFLAFKVCLMSFFLRRPQWTVVQPLMILVTCVQACVLLSLSFIFMTLSLFSLLLSLESNPTPSFQFLQPWTHCVAPAPPLDRLYTLPERRRLWDKVAASVRRHHGNYSVWVLIGSAFKAQLVLNRCCRLDSGPRGKYCLPRN